MRLARSFHVATLDYERAEIEAAAVAFATACHELGRSAGSPSCGAQGRFADRAATGEGVELVVDRDARRPLDHAAVATEQRNERVRRASSVSSGGVSRHGSANTWMISLPITNEVCAT